MSVTEYQSVLYLFYVCMSVYLFWSRVFNLYNTSVSIIFFSPLHHEVEDKDLSSAPGTRIP